MLPIMMCTNGNHSDAFSGSVTFFSCVCVSFTTFKAGKSISLYCLAWLEMFGKKLSNILFRNSINGLHCNESSSFTFGLNGHKYRSLASGASASFPRTLATHIRVIKFYQTFQAINTIPMSHGCSDFSQDAMSRRPANAKKLGCSKSRQATFVRGYQKNRPEPFD
jgi:hypothetical protein